MLVFGSWTYANYMFTYGDNNIQVVKDFKYFDIIFSRNRLFANTRKFLSDQDEKTLYDGKHTNLTKILYNIVHEDINNNDNKKNN